MDIVLVLRSIAALLLVVGCIYGLALLVRRAGEKNGSNRKRDKKLRIIEGLMIDQKRRLLRVENENATREYVILLGVDGEILVDAYDLKTKIHDLSEDFDQPHMPPKWPQNEPYTQTSSRNFVAEIEETDAENSATIYADEDDDSNENFSAAHAPEENSSEFSANNAQKTSPTRKRPARKRGNARKSSS